VTVARSKMIQAGEPGFYHCTSRCVRRAFLLGEDPYTGKNYDHRKQWVVDRLKLLSRAFAVEISGYAVMINHTHVLVWTRPDVGKAWSDREVALRWLKVFPKHADGYHLSKDALENVIELMVSDANLIGELRSRLCSISWFMRCLNEHIARAANEEDGVTGRFWQGRFGSQTLLDSSAVLAGLTYVDLNPIRSDVAETPEESDFTSAQDRIIARQARKKLSRLQPQTKPTSKKRLQALKQAEMIEGARRELRPDGWLSRFGKEVDGERKPFLNMELDEYLELLDWTGCQVKEGKPGKIPPHLAHILERLDIETDNWIHTVLHFGSLFFRVAGKVQSIVEATRRASQQWLRGKPAAKEIFG